MLVQPFVKGRKDLLSVYRDLLLNSFNFHTAPITAQSAERAAEIRAVYGLRLPDAIQVAFALDVGCQALVTNDRSMVRVKELSVLVLDDLET
ncbi:MAG TPA: PIN domain-containing protein [Pyrinomonadaceae bacterium]|nr:PIN domain-containing protein [Pyrinomonadaceae bacterium]